MSSRAAGHAVHEIESHHEVMLSKPRELAELLDRLAGQADQQAAYRHGGTPDTQEKGHAPSV